MAGVTWEQQVECASEHHRRWPECGAQEGTSWFLHRRSPACARELSHAHQHGRSGVAARWPGLLLFCDDVSRFPEQQRVHQLLGLLRPSLADRPVRGEQPHQGGFFHAQAALQPAAERSPLAPLQLPLVTRQAVLLTRRRLQPNVEGLGVAAAARSAVAQRVE